MITIYLDECGFTGEDLFNEEQPAFTMASLDLSENTCQKLKVKHFGNVKTKELKHSGLARRVNQQNMVIELIKDLFENYRYSVKFVVAHKRYVLITKIADYIIEPVLYDDGLNFYKDGLNIAYSNLLHLLLNSIASKSSFDKFLYKFQVMVREKTKKAYKDFFEPVLKNKFPDEINYLLLPIKLFDQRYGFSGIETLKRNTLDISLTSALMLMNKWKNYISQNEILSLFMTVLLIWQSRKKFGMNLLNQPLSQR